MPCAQFPLKVMQIACWVKVQINPMNREAFYCSKRHKMINPAKVSLSLRLPLLSFFSTAVLWYLIDMSMEPFFQSSWFHAPRQWRIFAREGSKLLFIHQEGQAKRQNICLFGKLWSDLCSLKSFSLLISQFPFDFISTAPMLLVSLRRLAKALLALAQTWIRPRKHLLVCILSFSWTTTYISGGTVVDCHFAELCFDLGYLRASRAEELC